MPEFVYQPESGSRHANILETRLKALEQSHLALERRTQSLEQEVQTLKTALVVSEQLRLGQAPADTQISPSDPPPYSSNLEGVSLARGARSHSNTGYDRSVHSGQMPAGHSSNANPPPMGYGMDDAPRVELRRPRAAASTSQPEGLLQIPTFQISIPSVQYDAFGRRRN